jgi:hypothetical protein
MALVPLGNDDEVVMRELIVAGGWLFVGEGVLKVKHALFRMVMHSLGKLGYLGVKCIVVKREDVKRDGGMGAGDG